MVTQEVPLDAAQTLTLEERRSFIKLPLEERRRLLTRQAERMIEIYESEADERAAWQGGDISNQ